MDNQSRIDRMERDGVLSPSQAVRLRDSIAGVGGLDDGEQAGAGRRRPVGGWLILPAVLVAVLAAVAVASGGGDTTFQDVT